MFNKDFEPNNLTSSQQVQLQAGYGSGRIYSSAKFIPTINFQQFKENFQYNQSLTHFNLMLYGYEHKTTNKRIQQRILDEQEVKHELKFHLTQQVKEFFDCLYKYEVSPSKQFEKFLIAVNSISIPQKYQQQNIKDDNKNQSQGANIQIEVQDSPNQQDYQSVSNTLSQEDLEQGLSEQESIQVEPIQTFESCLQTSIIDNNIEFCESRIGDNIIEKDTLDQTQIQYQKQIEILKKLINDLSQNVSWLISYIKSQRKYVLCFYIQFQHQLNQKLQQQYTSKKYNNLEEKDIYITFQREIQKYITKYINDNIVKAANEIYQQLIKQFNPYDHILVYSPSKLIINSVLIYNEYLLSQRIQNNFQVTLIYTDKLSLKEQLSILVQNKVKVSYVSLDVLPHFLQQQHPTVMLFGCQEITMNANAVSRAGCTSAAIFCYDLQIPIIAVSETYKFGAQENEQGEDIDVVESKFIQAIISEIGVLSCQSIRTYCL